MKYRAGFVGLVGLPNAGKSSLLNTLVGEKISIVTAKPQTTRRRIMGLVTDDNSQLVFVDAPGVIESTSGLNKFLELEAQDVMAQSDVLLVLLHLDEEKVENFEKLMEMVKKSKKPFVILIHKTDLPLEHRVRILSDRFGGLGAEILTGSSKSTDMSWLEQLKAALRDKLPVSEGPLYDPDYSTLSPVRDICMELIREQCFEKLHQEIPFSLAVRLLRFDESTSRVVKIYAELLVGKENHKAIVVGKGGQTLKAIGTQARLEIEKFLDQKVFLDLKVIAKKNWMQVPKIMKEMGYVVSDT